jgi:polyisoprenoid-binding protein YceI
MMSRCTQKSMLATFCAVAFIATSLPSFAQTYPAQAQTANPSPATSDIGTRYILNKQHTKIGFSIGHMVVSSTDGIFTAFDGKLLFNPQSPEKSGVSVAVSTASIDTDEKARDEHLRTADFFDVEKYPTATFQSTGIKLKSDNAGEVTGILTIHGIQKPVTFDVSLHRQGGNADTLEFNATATLLRSDFGMTGYRAMVGNEVTLNITAEFDKAS